MLPYIIAILFLPTANLKDLDAVFDKVFDGYYIEYHFYSRDRFSYPDVLTHGNDRALAASSIRRRNGTYVYIHGSLETAWSEGPQAFLTAYIRFTDCNVILVDWSTLTRISFHFQTGPSVPAIGKRVGLMLKWLEYHNRIAISDVHIIGFSLGAHIAGFVGRTLAPQQIRRITGLDPLYPSIMYQPASQRLAKTDAQFVDVIHMNTDIIGKPTPIGHADFLPNYGAMQPGCVCMDVRCSHQLAWRYYAESISNPFRFLGFNCKFKDLTVYNCQQFATTLMGHYANPRIHGLFYVKT